jgi:hypothetical protein
MASPPNIDNSLSNRHNKLKQEAIIKCVQLNLQHSRAVASNLTQIINHNIDIAFVHEPYSIHNKVGGFPKAFRIFAHGGRRKRAAIAVNDIDVTAIIQVSHKAAILIEIRYKGAKLFGTSLYLPIDRDTDRF